MTFWLNESAQLLVNAENQPIDCDTCPCAPGCPTACACTVNSYCLDFYDVPAEYDGYVQQGPQDPIALSTPSPTGVCVWEDDSPFANFGVSCVGGYWLIQYGLIDPDLSPYVSSYISAPIPGECPPLGVWIELTWQPGTPDVSGGPNYGPLQVMLN